MTDTKDRRRGSDGELEGGAVHHPSHYNQGKYEVIDVIEDWKLDFCLGNAVKYIARAPHKGKQVEDLRKAIEYLKLKVERIEVHTTITGTALAERVLLEQEALVNRKCETCKPFTCNACDGMMCRVCLGPVGGVEVECKCKDTQRRGKIHAGR